MPKYELIYPSGGHVGPYNNFVAAVIQAKFRLKPEGSMLIVDRSTGDAVKMTPMTEDGMFELRRIVYAGRIPMP